MCIKSSHSFQAEALNLVHFQEVPTGYEGSNHDEIVGEELVDATQEVEQEAIAMSKPDREVRYQQQSLTLDGSIPSNTQFFGRCMLRCCHLQKVPLPKVNLRQGK